MLGATGLAGLTFALIEAGTLRTPIVVAFAVLGAGACAAFVQVERTSRQPMMPPALFGSRQFSAHRAGCLVEGRAPTRQLTKINSRR